MDTTNSANSTAAAPLDTCTFDSCKRILEIQTLLADFVHYQNHVQLSALANLLEFVTPPEEQEKACIIAWLTEEQVQLKLLHKYLSIIHDTNKEVLDRIKDITAHPWGI